MNKRLIEYNYTTECISNAQDHCSDAIIHEKGFAEEYDFGEEPPVAYMLDLASGTTEPLDKKELEGAIQGLLEVRTPGADFVIYKGEEYMVMMAVNDILIVG
tara:strand:+ start:11975 stop:12280 length:306 start_codon:yes stop_codon:yes gene_type:complete